MNVSNSAIQSQQHEINQHSVVKCSCWW